MKVRLMATGGSYEVEQLGVFTPKPLPVESLVARARSASWSPGIKKVSDVAIGDTLTDEQQPARRSRCPASRRSSRWCSPGSTRWTPTSTRELRDALEKLRLNDSSFFYEPETSTALGFGFRCGFLGLLHMEIVQERLEREFNARAADHGALGALPRARRRTAR